MNTYKYQVNMFRDYIYFPEYGYVFLIILSLNFCPCLYVALAQLAGSYLFLFGLCYFYF